MKKRIAALILSTILILTLFAGCGSSSKSYDASRAESSAPYDYGYANDFAAEEAEWDMKSDADVPTAYSSDSLNIETEPGRLVILYADVSIETTEYDESIAALRENVEKVGGYISASNASIYNNAYSLHSGYYTVRVPADKFNDFVAMQDAIGLVNYCNVWSDDVTGSYREIETRLKTLRTKYDRLLAMLEEAEIMADIIEIENAMSQTMYEIESYEGSLKSYDDRIQYSTITMEIREVRETVEPVTMPKTLSERISIRFKEAMRNTGDFFEDFIVGLIGALPGIVIIGVIAVIVILIVVKTRGRRLLRREKRREKNEKLLRELREKRDSRVENAAEVKIEEKTESKNK